MNYEKEHENWVRFNCLKKAIKFEHSRNKPEEIIKTARVFSDYVLDVKKNANLKLTKPPSN